MNRTILLTAAVSCLTLDGCGMQQVQVNSASAVATAATQVSTDAAQALDAADARRESAWSTLIASDPSCSPLDKLVILVPDRPGLPVASLCADGNSAPIPTGYTRQTIYGGPMPSGTVKPTLDLISVVAVYGAAMGKIASEPKADISDDVAHALALRGKAEALASTAGIANLPDLAKLTADQKTSAIALLNFMLQLEQVQRQAKGVSKLYHDNSAAIDMQLTTLEDQVDMWNTLVAQQWARVEVQRLEAAYEREKDKMSFEQRRAFVVQIRSAQAAPGQIATAAAKMKQAIKLLRENQADLGHALDDPTPEQRRQAARVVRQRALTAIGLLGDAIAAWAPLAA